MDKRINHGEMPRIIGKFESLFNQISPVKNFPFNFL